MAAKFNEFGQKGVADNVQFGKRNGRIKFDAGTDDAFFRDATDDFYLQVHGADPTEITHFTTKKYVDDEVSAIGAAARFYLTIAETDGDPTYTGISKINYNSDDFYLTQNVGNTDEATINLRGSLRDPLFRSVTIGTVATNNIGIPLPIHAIVKRVKLVVTERYSTNSVEIVVRSASLAADQIYMPEDENDPRDTKEETFISEGDPRQVEIDGARQIVATVSASPAAGAAVIIAEYLLP